MHARSPHYTCWLHPAAASRKFLSMSILFLHAHNTLPTLTRTSQLAFTLMSHCRHFAWQSLFIAPHTNHSLSFILTTHYIFTLTTHCTLTLLICSSHLLFTIHIPLTASCSTFSSFHTPCWPSFTLISPHWPSPSQIFSLVPTSPFRVGALQPQPGTIHEMAEG